MGAGPQNVYRKENSHFLSLLAIGAVLLTIFFLLVGTTNQTAHFVDGGPERPPARRQSMERQRRVQSWVAMDSEISSNGRGTLAATKERSLVVYIYDRSDPVFTNNLNYFIRRGIAGGESCDYVFIVQNAENPQVANSLPRLPTNARWYYSQQPSCTSGFGLLAELFASGSAKKAEYNFYILLSSAFRGPFIPSFAAEEKHWSQYFTQRLNSKVKLVGPTISCHEPPLGQEGGLGQSTPHVQFSAIATDQPGLAILESEAKVMQCYDNILESQTYSEIGASAAILKANYSLDSFMTRYRKVEWLEKQNWGCNERLNPLSEFKYDGLSVNPYEVMFVPMSTIAIENGWSSAKLAAQYETWMFLQDQGDNDISTNVWVSDPWPVKRQRIAYMQSRGPGCFDNRYYLQKNPDLKAVPTPVELWDHFVMMGQFEGRSFRWSCEDDRKLPWE